MINPNAIKNEDLAIEKQIKRFIDNAERSIINGSEEEKVISLSQYKEEQKTKDEVSEYLDMIAINTGEAIFDILGAKVRIATGANIAEPDSGVDFTLVFNLFKAGVEHVETVYKQQDQDLYALPLFVVIDVITTLVAGQIAETYMQSQVQE
jgi:hypothetical protein